MIEIDISELTKLPEFELPPERVVSLVPSLTESLFGLGFGASVVGITDFCIHPAEELPNIPRVGGPKNPDVELITQLKPQLVFANQEENSPSALRDIQEAGIKVWMSFPRTVDEALDVLRHILAIYHTDKPAIQITTLRMAVDYARAASESQQRVKYFCPVWQDVEGGIPWWMTFNQNTYAHDLLEVLGGENIFKNRERRFPLKADLGLGEPVEEKGRDTRYPRVTAEEIIQAAPDIILLPSEPFAFTEEHKRVVLEELGETPAIIQDRIHFVDGSLITWHGTRIGKALLELPQFFE